MSTLLLLGAGALVTSTGSSLAVPDWPLAYGQFFPPMVGGILYEHGHRMIASLVGLISIILAVVLFLGDHRLWVRWMGLGALALVIVQGVLGGITVLLLLPKAVSVSHALVAQLFFLLTVVLAQITAPGWESHLHGQWTGHRPRVAIWAIVTLVLLYATLLIGAIVRHTGAGLAIPDFPLAYGRLIPPNLGFHVAIHFTHRVLALIVLIMVGLTLWRALKAYPRAPGIRRPAMAMAVLMVVQILLGWGVIASLKSVTFTTLHLVNGAMLIGATGLLAFRAALGEFSRRGVAEGGEFARR